MRTRLRSGGAEDRSAPARGNCARLLWLVAAAALAHAQPEQVVFNAGNQQRQYQSWTPGGGTERNRGVIATGGSTSNRAVCLEFKVMAEPPLRSPGSFGGGIMRDGNTIHRLFFDRTGPSYVGYDLVVLSGDASTGYQVAFQSLSNLTEMRERFAGDLTLKQMPEPVYPSPQLVHVGDTIALDLMVSADGRQKIVDYLKLSPPLSSEPPAPAATGEPRDYSVDDAPIGITIQSFVRTSVSIGGRKFTGRVGFLQGNGGVLWIYFPGQGRYVLSLAPHQGFFLAGAIRDNSMQFRDGGGEFEVRLDTPIAGAGNAFNLYLLHDPSYRPRPEQAGAVIVGLGRLQNLVPKQ
jgi:hypothetical protein